MRKINYPILALIIANIIWGATSPIIKYSLENIPPFSLAFLRFLIASLILYPFVHSKINYPDLKNKWLWAYSLFGITLNISFFFAALERTSAINATIIASTGPVMILIGSAIFLKERFKLNVIFGVVLALIGVTIIIFQPVLEQEFNGAMFGNLLMLLATLGAVIATIAGRKFLTEKNALGATFWACFIGCSTFLPFMLWEFWQNPGWIVNLDSRGFIGIIYGAVFSSTIAYAAYNWALAKLPAFKTSVFTYIDPIVAVLIAIPLLGEKLTMPFIIGSVLVFLGILIAEHRLPYHPLHKILNSDKI